MKIYAIYDRLAETYTAPFVLEERVAQRTFEWMKKDASEQQRADREIRELGEWSEKEGFTMISEPKKVFELAEVKKDD